MESIYMQVLAATLILGLLMPQSGRNRKYYILLMTALHVFVSGFRYFHLTGDLMKYHATYLDLWQLDWLSCALYNDGRNFGFFLYLKLLGVLTNGNFQMVLFSIAVIIHVILALAVYRYSPAPWMSYLIWNGLGFYLFGFSAIKQSLAMAFVMLSFSGIANRNRKQFLVCMAVAGAVHMPALIFLPAYPLARIRLSPRILIFYLLSGILLFLSKDRFVNWLSSLYYVDGDLFVFTGKVGNRFWMILGFTLFSILFSGFRNPNLEKLFPVIAVSAMIQIFSGYSNLFTRMADYYFQLSVLYLPMLFYTDRQPVQPHSMTPLLPFNARSKQLLAALLCGFVIWFYYTYNINVSIPYAVDNYLNYRFLWDVK